MAIKCVSFDLDNTLWHTDPVIERANHKMLLWLGQHTPSFGVDYISQRSPKQAQSLPIAAHVEKEHPVSLALLGYLSHLRKAVIDAQPEIAFSVSQVRWQMLFLGLSEAGYQGKELEKVTNAAYELFVAARREVTPFKSVLPMLDELRDLGLDCIALTNGNACIKQAGLDKHLSAQYTADDLGVMKPDPKSFLRAFEQHRLAPHQVIHVGDNLVDDIDGAKSVGSPHIWVNLQKQEVPDHVITLEQLAHSCHQPEQTVMVTELQHIPKVVQWMCESERK